MLPITLTAAAAATLLHLWLAIRVGRVRLSSHIMTGDGGDLKLQARMRAHANYIENTPFFLILLGLIERSGGNRTALLAAAFVFIMARIAHGFGMDRPAPNVLRAGGFLLSTLVLLGLAGYALAIVYGVGGRA